MVALLQPINQGQPIPIDRAVVLVGRSPECDAIIDFSSKISRLHCALIQVDAKYFVRDLGSMNGVFVGGQRVEKELLLTNGVEIAIGDVKFQFLENVQTPIRQVRVVPGKSGGPAFIDETQRPAVPVAQPSTILQSPSGAGRGSSSTTTPPPITTGRPQATPASDSDYQFELVDAIEVVDDADVLDLSDSAIVDVQDVEVVDEDVEVLDVVEEVDDIEEIVVIDDIEVIEDVDILPDSSHNTRRRPGRLR